MSKKLVLVLFIFIPFFSIGQCELTNLTNKSHFQIKLPSFIVQSIKYEVEVTGIPNGEFITIKAQGKTHTVKIENSSFKFKFDHSATYKFVYKKSEIKKDLKVMPLWYSIIPPLLAILFAMLFKEVLTALLIGLLSGTAAISFFSGAGNVIESIGDGLLDIIDNRVIHTIADAGHASVIVFSLLIGAVVQIIRKNGGMYGLVQRLARKVSTRKKGMIFTWLMGIIIFFDDYANTLVVGNTVRPVTDKLKISREKLAYIVDSTAAPVACLAFVTTWIGVELSYIQEGLTQIPTELSAYQLFMHSLPYRLYPIFALVFILILIMQKKDYGPMYNAEIKAEKMQLAENIEDSDDALKPSHWLNAVLPIAIIVFGTFAGLISTGYSHEVWANENLSFIRKLSFTIGASDAFKALLWSSMIAVLTAFILSVIKRLLTLRQASDAIIDGFRAMLSAIVILILAWSLATITQELHTAEFLAGILSSLKALPGLLPAITFILGALVAFSTGSSWGTMAILYPLLMPVTWKISEMSGMEIADANNLLAQMIAGILAGAVLGDHCSPISDTTILSSLASSCDHIEHVRTQMPYALTVGGIVVVLGLVPLIWNVPLWIIYPVILGVLYLIVRKFGKST
jgi:Na+/H+ antiporter NhaC